MRGVFEEQPQDFDIDEVMDFFNGFLLNAYAH